MFYPVFVSNSRRAKGDHLNSVKDFVKLEIDEGEIGQATSERNTCDVELVEASLVSNLNKVFGDVISNSVPHFVVSTLDFAFLASVFVSGLEGIEDVLPEIQSVGSVSESKDDILRVNTEDALDLGLLVVNVMGMDGFVGVIASCTNPKFEIFGSANNQRVGKDHLVVPGQSVEGYEEGAESQENLANHSKLIYK